MSHTVRRRGAQALGTAAIFMLAFGGPATARPDEAGGTQQGSNATAQINATAPITDEQRRNECHYQNKCSGTPSPTPPSPGGGNGYDVEYLQLGAGVLAGIGLGGAGMAAASRRRHGHAALLA